MQFANRLTKQQLKTFLESYNSNIKVKSLEGDLPCTEEYIQFSPYKMMTLCTYKFDNLHLYFSDTDFRFGTTPVLYDDKKLTNAWRQFLAKTFEKENYVDFLKQELNKQIESLKQDRDSFR